MNRITQIIANLFLSKLTKLSIISVLIIILYGNDFLFVTSATLSENADITVTDPNLRVEHFFSGSGFPSSMAFLGPNDILVLEKNTGNVQRIVNGEMLEEPILEVDVSSQGEGGLLGIAVANNNKGDDDIKDQPTYVFLYYTEVKDVTAIDNTENRTIEGGLLSNHLYKYELDNNNNKLVNPKLLLDLPASARHNGGAIIIGPDNNIYVPIGAPDEHDINSGSVETLVQNVKNGSNPDGRAGIIGVTQNGEMLNSGEGILGDEHPRYIYYAYGIRNSFGIDFDPVTGILWDTENGPGDSDEINLVEPGFNSGWSQIQGMSSISSNIEDNSENDNSEDFVSGNLVDFDGRGKYSDPEFTWLWPTVGVTAIKFLSSDKLGEEYENDLFVGDYNNGYLYHFNLNEDRTALILDEPLDDKIADNTEEIEAAVFARGFDRITDIEVNPYDGNLYILSIPDKQGCNDDYSSTCVNSAIFRMILDSEE